MVVGRETKRKGVLTRMSNPQLCVWKYQLTVPYMSLALPEYAIILSCGLQDNFPTFWALVDREQELVSRQFQLYGTGHSIPDLKLSNYVGRIDQPPFVWHLFEVTKKGEK